MAEGFFRTKIFHKPVGIWLELVAILIFILWEVKQFKTFGLPMFLPCALTATAFFQLFRKDISGYLLANAANMFVIYFVFSIILTKGHALVHFFLVGAALFGIYVLKTNRKWFNEVLS